MGGASLKPARQWSRLRVTAVLVVAGGTVTATIPVGTQPVTG